MPGAFPEISRQHFDVEVFSCRVSHAEEPMIALNLPKSKAMGEVLVEVPAVGLVNRCCSLDRFIHASCPNTVKTTLRPAASVVPMEKPVVVLVWMAGAFPVEVVSS